MVLQRCHHIKILFSTCEKTCLFGHIVTLFIGFIVKMKIVMQKIVILINRESNKKFVKITLLQPYHATQKWSRSRSTEHKSGTIFILKFLFLKCEELMLFFVAYMMMNWVLDSLFDQLSFMIVG